MRDVNGGWALRYVHSNGASLFFFAVYCHIFRGIYYGSYKTPREITWIIGMLIFLLMMATAFMGYVLPWGQMSFWGATVITGLFSAIPLVGPDIQTWLLGGPAVDNPTLSRFFSLHYLLPFVIAGLVAVHIWAFHTTGNNNPTGVEVRRTSRKEADADTLPFWPYFVIKDLFALVFILTDLRGDRRLHAELPRPPRQLHRGGPAQDAEPHRAGMVLPALLRHAARHHLRRPLDQLEARGRAGHVRLDRGACCSCPGSTPAGCARGATGRCSRSGSGCSWSASSLLMWCGSQPPEQPFVIISQLATLYWFVFFLVILPLLGVIEKPLTPPDDDRGRLPGALRHRRGGDGARRDQQAGRMSGEGSSPC